VSQKRYREPRRRLTNTQGDQGIAERVGSLIHDRLAFLAAGADELLALCRDHQAVFGSEFMTVWSESADDDRLFRRTREQFAAVRIDPGEFNLMCIHELGEFQADGEAFFRLLWLSLQNVPKTFFTPEEHGWMERNFDRLRDRGGEGRDWDAVKAKHTYVGIGLAYAEQVVSGKIPACQWVKLACQRQLDDLKRAQQPDPQPLGEAVLQKILKFRPKEQ